MTEAQKDAVRQAYRVLQMHLSRPAGIFHNATLKAITHLEEAFGSELDLEQ